MKTETKLICREISRAILWAIQQNLPININMLPDAISLEELEQLRTNYKKKLGEISIKTLGHPRNQVFYMLLQDKFPQFSWDAVSYSGNKGYVKFHAPRINKREISLLSLLLNDFEFESEIGSRYPALKKLPRELRQDIEILLQKLRIVNINKMNMAFIVDWLLKGLAGDHLHLFSLACPDYSTEPTDNPLCPFRHTFNELGSGIGLIAKRNLEAFPLIAEVLDKHHIKWKMILAMADYEVLSEANRNRLKLSFDEFLSRLKHSRAAFQGACAIKIETPLISELCKNYDSWLNLYNYYHKKLIQKDFGLSGLTSKKLLNIIKSRKALYERWFGLHEQLEDYLPYLLAQGAEYAAVGAIVRKQYSNCLILGADHFVFSSFYNFDGVIPTLYLKRFYC